LSRLWVVILVFGAGSAASAFPTSCNLIPTADMLEVGSVRAELERDGALRFSRTQGEGLLLLQYAPTSRLEAGIDLYSIGNDDSLLFNAKWLLVTEERRRPAVAVGILEIGAQYSPTSYIVGAKDFGGRTRVHAGAAACRDAKALLLGVEFEVGRKDYLLVDWASWPSGYLSLGVCRQMSEDTQLSLAYAWPNDRAEPGMAIVNLSRTFALH